MNVYQAARQRVKWCFENFDEVVVTYSGGKDSMVVCLLAKEVMDELGLDKRLKVVFYDEEFVYPETLEAIDAMFSLPWVDGYRLCMPMEYQLTLPDGSEHSFRLWDETRGLLRPFPERAVRTTKHYSMTEAEVAVSEMIFSEADKGKRIVLMMGIRAQESITRRSTILQKWKAGPFCFIRKSKVLNIAMASPVYDWRTEDIFFYIKNQDVLKLNKLYFLEMLAKKPLRTSPPIHSKARLHLEKIKIENPHFYEMLLKVFPSIDTTARYAGALAQYADHDATIAKYGCSVRGIKNYILKNIKGDLQPFALASLKQFLRDYVEYDRYTKYGHSYESAVKKCFVAILKGDYGKTIMLNNVVQKKGRAIIPV